MTLEIKLTDSLEEKRYQQAINLELKVTKTAQESRSTSCLFSSINDLLITFSRGGDKAFTKRIHDVWKSQKKSYSTLRAKRATITFWVDKSLLKMPKMVNLLRLWNLEVCDQTVLPDRLILIGQKMVENAKNETVWVIFKQCGMGTYL